MPLRAKRTIGVSAFGGEKRGEINEEDNEGVTVTSTWVGARVDGRYDADCSKAVGPMYIGWDEEKEVRNYLPSHILAFETTLTRSRLYHARYRSQLELSYERTTLNT
ncbi:hypothetical protein NMY22_g3510 [Coprinellus aureogranulatus]|nr:hypothetical protein NMY22_g3510 [Coprinellus aureogranulatus]